MADGSYNHSSFPQAGVAAHNSGSSVAVGPSSTESRVPLASFAGGGVMRRIGANDVSAKGANHMPATGARGTNGGSENTAFAGVGMRDKRTLPSHSHPVPAAGSSGKYGEGGAAGGAAGSGRAPLPTASSSSSSLRIAPPQPLPAVSRLGPGGRTMYTATTPSTARNISMWDRQMNAVLGSPSEEGEVEVAEGEGPQEEGVPVIHSGLEGGPQAVARQLSAQTLSADEWLAAPLLGMAGVAASGQGPLIHSSSSSSGSIAQVIEEEEEEEEVEAGEDARDVGDVDDDADEEDDGLAVSIEYIQPGALVELAEERDVASAAASGSAAAEQDDSASPRRINLNIGDGIASPIHPAFDDDASFLRASAAAPPPWSPASPSALLTFAEAGGDGRKGMEDSHSHHPSSLAQSSGMGSSGQELFTGESARAILRDFPDSPLRVEPTAPLNLSALPPSLVAAAASATAAGAAAAVQEQEKEQEEDDVSSLASNKQAFSFFSPAGPASSSSAHGRRVFENDLRYDADHSTFTGLTPGARAGAGAGGTGNNMAAHSSLQGKWKLPDTPVGHNDDDSNNFKILQLAAHASVLFAGDLGQRLERAAEENKAEVDSRKVDSNEPLPASASALASAGPSPTSVFAGQSGGDEAEHVEEQGEESEPESFVSGKTFVMSSHAVKSAATISASGLQDTQSAHGRTSQLTPSAACSVPAVSSVAAAPAGPPVRAGSSAGVSAPPAVASDSSAAASSMGMANHLHTAYVPSLQVPKRLKSLSFLADASATSVSTDMPLQNAGAEAVEVSFLFSAANVTLLGENARAILGTGSSPLSLSGEELSSVLSISPGSLVLAPATKTSINISFRAADFIRGAAFRSLLSNSALGSLSRSLGSSNFSTVLDFTLEVHAGGPSGPERGGRSSALSSSTPAATFSQCNFKIAAHAEVRGCAPHLFAPSRAHSPAIIAAPSTTAASVPLPPLTRPPTATSLPASRSATPYVFAPPPSLAAAGGIATATAVESSLTGAGIFRRVAVEQDRAVSVSRSTPPVAWGVPAASCSRSEANIAAVARAIAPAAAAGVATPIPSFSPPRVSTASSSTPGAATMTTSVPLLNKQAPIPRKTPVPPQMTIPTTAIVAAASGVVAAQPSASAPAQLMPAPTSSYVAAPAVSRSATPLLASVGPLGFDANPLPQLAPAPVMLQRALSRASPVATPGDNARSVERIFAVPVAVPAPAAAVPSHPAIDAAAFSASHPIAETLMEVSRDSSTSLEEEQVSLAEAYIRRRLAATEQVAAAPAVRQLSAAASVPTPQIPAAARVSRVSHVPSVVPPPATSSLVSAAAGAAAGSVAAAKWRWSHDASFSSTDSAPSSITDVSGYIVRAPGAHVRGFTVKKQSRHAWRGRQQESGEEEDVAHVLSPRPTAASRRPSQERSTRLPLSPFAKDAAMVTNAAMQRSQAPSRTSARAPPRETVPIPRRPTLPAGQKPVAASTATATTMQTQTQTQTRPVTAAARSPQSVAPPSASFGASMVRKELSPRAARRVVAIAGGRGGVASVPLVHPRPFVPSSLAPSIPAVPPAPTVPVRPVHAAPRVSSHRQVLVPPARVVIPAPPPPAAAAALAPGAKRVPAMEGVKIPTAAPMAGPSQLVHQQQQSTMSSHTFTNAATAPPILPPTSPPSSASSSRGASGKQGGAWQQWESPAAETPGSDLTSYTYASFAPQRSASSASHLESVCGRIGHVEHDEEDDEAAPSLAAFADAREASWLRTTDRNEEARWRSDSIGKAGDSALASSVVLSRAVMADAATSTSGLGLAAGGEEEKMEQSRGEVPIRTRVAMHDSFCAPANQGVEEEEDFEEAQEEKGEAEPEEEADHGDSEIADVDQPEESHTSAMLDVDVQLEELLGDSHGSSQGPASEPAPASPSHAATAPAPSLGQSPFFSPTPMDVSRALARIRATAGVVLDERVVAELASLPDEQEAQRLALYESACAERDKTSAVAPPPPSLAGGAAFSLVDLASAAPAAPLRTAVHGPASALPARKAAPRFSAPSPEGERAARLVDVFGAGSNAWEVSEGSIRAAPAAVANWHVLPESSSISLPALVAGPGDTTLSISIGVYNAGRRDTFLEVHGPDEGGMLPVAAGEDFLSLASPGPSAQPPSLLSCLAARTRIPPRSSGSVGVVVSLPATGRRVRLYGWSWHAGLRTLTAQISLHRVRGKGEREEEGEQEEEDAESGGADQCVRVSVAQAAWRSAGYVYDAASHTLVSTGQVFATADGAVAAASSSKAPFLFSSPAPTAPRTSGLGLFASPQASHPMNGHGPAAVPAMMSSSSSISLRKVHEQVATSTTAAAPSAGMGPWGITMSPLQAVPASGAVTAVGLHPVGPRTTHKASTLPLVPHHLAGISHQQSERPQSSTLQQPSFPGPAPKVAKPKGAAGVNEAPPAFAAQQPTGLQFAMRTIYFPAVAEGENAKVRVQLCNTSTAPVVALVTISSTSGVAESLPFSVKRAHQSITLGPRSFCMLPVSFHAPSCEATGAAATEPLHTAVLVVHTKEGDSRPTFACRALVVAEVISSEQ